jgi:hypothetical protein
MRTPLLIASLLIAACGVEIQGKVTPKADDPNPSPPSPQPPAPTDVDMGTDDAATCGGMQFQVERVPPNVMLVIDRSGSMGEAIGNGSTTTKWADLKVALQQLVIGYDAQMRLGLTVYSSDGNCAPGTLTALAPTNGANILSKINAQGPAGNTPTAGALATVIAQGNLKDATRENVVVLATDGLPNCGDVDVAGKITTLYNQTPSVKTYVIGVGAGTASNPVLLNAWADAGHTARAGATKYYQTNSQTELKAAFDAIAGGIASCTFKMSQAAPDPSKLYVFENSIPVAMDAQSGYTFDQASNSITLHGSSCDKLKTDPMTKIQVVYGCPSAPPPPPIN